MSASGFRFPGAAIVLAGGRSTRMGCDKVTMEVQGEPLLLRVLARVSSVCEKVVVVAPLATQAWLSKTKLGQTNFGQTKLRQKKLHKSWPSMIMVADLEPWVGQGPLAGLLAGLSQLPLQAMPVHLVACDALHWSPANLQVLWQAMQAAKSHAAWWIEGDGKGHPLHGIVDRAWALARTRALLLSGERRLRQLFAGDEPSAKVVALDVHVAPQPLAFSPCNTPQELAMLIEQSTQRLD